MRVVTGADAPAEAMGVPACRLLPDVIGWARPEPAGPLRVLTLVPEVLAGDRRLRGCSWRTMWIVRRMTFVRTSAAGVRSVVEAGGRSVGRSEKPATPAASRAAVAPAIRVCVRCIGGPPGRIGGHCARRQVSLPQTAGKGSAKLTGSLPRAGHRLTCREQAPRMTTIRCAHATDGIVIAGGGLAGQRCAEMLRREGWERPIRVLCEEPYLPYDRPPLSKEMLTRVSVARDLSFRSADWYVRNGIELLPGVAATHLSPAEHRVELSTGERLRYDRLLIATGGRPRGLELFSGFDNVSVLRTVDDARTLRERLLAVDRLALVGAGFVGLEIAASARSLGLEVTIVEALPAPLAHVFGSELGRWFTQLHERHGVHVLAGRTVRRAVGHARIRSLRLSDETVVEADHVVVGVGSDPRCAWLAGSGLDAAAGVPVDARGQTSIPDVFAAGDAAAVFDPNLGRHVPGSHWEQAARQGARAAVAMLGGEPGRPPLTSFWTDQYEIRIQYLGRSSSTDHVQIDGDPGVPCFTATFHRDSRPVAALLVDRPRSLPAARRMIEEGVLS